MDSEKLSKITIRPETSIKSAMQTLSSAGNKLLVVTDEEGRLKGTLTDGDIRRGILNGMDFNQPVSKTMHRSPRFVRRSEKDFIEKAKRLVIEEKLNAVPVLDETNRITDILFWYNFFEKRPHEAQALSPVSNPVVIMAGGQGTRLDPFTKILPKPLIPVGDKPIIEKIMDGFYAYGFVNFMLSLNYKKEIIKMYLKENPAPYHIECIEEESYSGTAGSLGILKGRIKETFFVSNCDVFLEHDLKKIFLWHKGENSLVTMVGCHKEVTIPYGTLEMEEGSLISINEKPALDLFINTGIYIMEPEVLNLITAGERLDMDRLIERVMMHGKVAVYPIYDGWFDIGQWKEYKESLHFLEGRKTEP